MTHVLKDLTHKMEGHPPKEQSNGSNTACYEILVSCWTKFMGSGLVEKNNQTATALSTSPTFLYNPKIF